MRIQWNTGALYCAEGQIIVAELLEDCILFRDHSRMIWGRIELPKYFPIADEYDLKERVYTAYLHNRYTYDSRAELLKRSK